MRRVIRHRLIVSFGLYLPFLFVLCLSLSLFLPIVLEKEMIAFGADSISRQIVVREEEKDERMHQFPQILEEEGETYRLKEISQKIIEEEKRLLTKYSDIYEDAKEIPQPPEQYREENGDGYVYQLVETQIEDMMIPETRTVITEKAYFEALEDVSLIPHEKDGATGRLTLASIAEGEAYWRRDVFFTVLFRRYQASAYMLDG